MKASWRTTLFGFLAGIALLAGQAQTILDDDPDTNPEYTAIMAAFGMISLGWNARDNRVADERAGAR